SCAGCPSSAPRGGSVVSSLHCMNDPQPEGHMASYIRRRKFLATFHAVRHRLRELLPNTVDALLDCPCPADRSYLRCDEMAGYPRSGRALTPGMDASIALGSRASGDASHVRRRRCKNVECGRQCPGRAHSAGARDVRGRDPYWVMADLPRRPDNGSRGSRDSMARTIGAAASVGSACSDCGHRAVGLATATGA